MVRVSRVHVRVCVSTCVYVCVHVCVRVCIDRTSRDIGVPFILRRKSVARCSSPNNPTSILCVRAHHICRRTWGCITSCIHEWCIKSVLQQELTSFSSAPSRWVGFERLEWAEKERERERDLRSKRRKRAASMSWIRFVAATTTTFSPRELNCRSISVIKQDPPYLS